VALPPDLACQIALLPRQLIQCPRQSHRHRIAAAIELFLQQRKDRVGQHVHAEEAEIVSGTQPRDQQPALGFRRCRLLQDTLDPVEPLALLLSQAANRPVVGEPVLSRRFNRRDRTLLCPGDLHQLRRARAVGVTDIQVVTDHVQEGIVANELPRTVKRMSVASLILLHQEPELALKLARCLAVGMFLTAADDQRHLLRPGALHLGQKHLQRTPRPAGLIHQRLQRERSLVAGRGSDHSLLDFHGDAPSLNGVIPGLQSRCS